MLLRQRKISDTSCVELTELHVRSNVSGVETQYHVECVDRPLTAVASFQEVGELRVP